MIPAVTIDERDYLSPFAFCDRVLAALDRGTCVHLRPDPRWGFFIVRNGPAILATDFDKAPIGTFLSLTDALAAWERAR